MRNQFELIVSLGRRTSNDITTVDSLSVDSVGGLDEQTLIKAAKKRIKQYATPKDKDGVGQCLSMATQVLIWDATWNGPHNLIAVYDIRGGKLTML